MEHESIDFHTGNPVEETSGIRTITRVNEKNAR